jgi:adenylate kinase family enzyme
MDFPLFKTKIENSRKFNLADPSERWEYFRLKAGPEIEKLKAYLENNTFIVYLLGKKNSGKGTYAKLFVDIFGADKAVQISMGDIIRSVHKTVAEGGQKDLEDYLKANYRGYISVEQAINALLGRDTKTLLPTEFMLALLKREIAKLSKKALFLDGFPRSMDQVSYSLFFRELIGYRDDPDVMVLIDIPEKVIDERMKYRVVCPNCQAPRNLKLFPTNKVGYNQSKKEFYLICDEVGCQGARMAGKEGDDLGIETIRERLNTDAKLMEQALLLFGIPKVLLRNHLPADKANDFADNYEITPEYSYEWDEAKKEVRVLEKPWVFKDDEGVQSVSLLAPPVVVSLIKQLVQVLSL